MMSLGYGGGSFAGEGLKMETRYSFAVGSPSESWGF